MAATWLSPRKGSAQSNRDALAAFWITLSFRVNLFNRFFLDADCLTRICRVYLSIVMLYEPYIMAETHHSSKQLPRAATPQAIRKPSLSANQKPLVYSLKST